MRILFLASYFPTPTNLTRGNWALEQALALRDAGHFVEVVVPTSWIPKIAGSISHLELSGRLMSLSLGRLKGYRLGISDGPTILGI